MAWRGITPELAAKVTFDGSVRLIAAFANGPAGANPNDILRICSVGPEPSPS